MGEVGTDPEGVRRRACEVVARADARQTAARGAESHRRRLCFAIAPGSSDGQAPKKGGVLRIGMTGEPPTLDAHATTTVITREIGINMFETLLALDAKYQPVPHLIDGHETPDGGKRYVFRLRKDIRFHNGKLCRGGEERRRGGAGNGGSVNRALYPSYARH
jgi:ABC-type transport system substrate-binding protein